MIGWPMRKTRWSATGSKVASCHFHDLAQGAVVSSASRVTKIASPGPEVPGATSTTIW